MAEISHQWAWQLNDASFEQDAIALWRRTLQLPADTSPENRAKELSSVAYHGDALAGVTTVELQDFPQLRQRFAFYRVLIAPDFRGQDIAGPLGRAAYRALESWAIRNPTECVAGFASIRQSRYLIENYRSPYSRSTDAVLLAYTEEGYQVRIRWFDHFRPG